MCVCSCGPWEYNNEYALARASHDYIIGAHMNEHT